MEKFILYYAVGFLIAMIISFIISYYLAKKRFEKYVEFLKKCSKEDSDEYINVLMQKYENKE